MHPRYADPPFRSWPAPVRYDAAYRRGAGRRYGRQHGQRYGGWPGQDYRRREPARPDPWWPRERDAGRPRRGERLRRRWERLRERDRERGWSERARELLRRHREPIIGLTIAGAAAPLARPERPARTAPPPGTAERMLPGRPAAGPLEAEIGERWARRAAEQVREDTIHGAMIRYDISRDLAEDIYDAAIENDIEPEVAFGLVNTESAFDPRAISYVGARGLTQVMPRTAQWLRPGTTAEDLFDRRLNLRLGFSYLRSLIDKYDGNLRLALLAYNRGPGTVDRVLARGGDPDNGYADMVLSG